MSRIIITDPESGETLGWFDDQKGQWISSGTRWNGNNRVSCATGSEWIDETLFLTSRGRWVLSYDATRYHNGTETYRFLTAEEARNWAIKAEVGDEVIDKYWPGTPDEAVMGRPEIGPAVKVRLPADVLELLDATAVARGVTRAALIRDLLTDAVR